MLADRPPECTGLSAPQDETRPTLSRRTTSKDMKDWRTVRSLKGAWNARKCLCVNGPPATVRFTEAQLRTVRLDGPDRPQAV